MISFCCNGEVLPS